jgi:hypothetical protein
MDAGVDDTLMPSARRATFEPLLAVDLPADVANAMVALAPPISTRESDSAARIRLPSLRVIDAGLEAIAA